MIRRFTADAVTLSWSAALRIEPDPAALPQTNALERSAPMTSTMTSTRRSVLTALAAACVLSAPLAAPAAAQTTKLKLVLNWKYQGPQGMFFIADDKGYFKEEGL